MKDDKKIEDIVSEIPETDDEKLLESLFKEEADDSGERDKYAKVVKQKGFYIAVLNKDDKEEKLLAAKITYREEQVDSQKTLDVVYRDCIDKINTRITKIELEIKEKQQEKKQEHEDMSHLKSRKQKIEEDIQKIYEELADCRKSLLLSQDGVEHKFISKIDAEITKLSDLQKKLYDDVNVLNRKKYDDLKTGLNSIKEKLIKNRDNYEARFQLINEKLKRLGADGIGHYASYILLYIGTATTAVAGYFFAIFSSQSDFSNQDMLSFLLTNILQSVGEDKHSFLYKSLVLFGFVTILTLVSWIVHMIIVKGLPAINKQLGTDTERIAMAAKFEGENLSYSSSVQTKSWFAFWLRMVPPVLIFGFIIIIISINGVPLEQANKLSASTEGLVVGAAFALGLAAVVYVYIIKVIEPRLEENAQEADTVRILQGDGSSTPIRFRRGWSRKIKLNWELAMAVVLFFFSALLFVFYQQEVLPKNVFANPAISISVIGFTASSILSSFAFAYGVRYFGLLESARTAQADLNNIDISIATFSVPAAPDVQQSLRQNIQMLNRVQHDLIAKRGSILVNRGRKEVIKVPGQVQQSWQRMFSGAPFFRSLGKKSSEDDDQIFEVYDWEMEYYPDITAKMKMIRTEYLEKKRELAETEAKIETLRKKSKEKEVLLEKKIRKLDNRILKLQLLKGKAYKFHFDRAEKKKRKLEEEIGWLEDGYALGLWHLKNNAN